MPNDLTWPGRGRPPSPRWLSSPLGSHNFLVGHLQMQPHVETQASYRPFLWRKLLILIKSYIYIYIFFFFPFFLVFLGPHPQHMEVPRLGVKSELQLLAYASATATEDPSRVCNPHHSSQQCQILNTLSKARDRNHNLMVPSRIRFCCTTTGTPRFSIFYH